MGPTWGVFFMVALLPLLWSGVDGVAVMSIDLGSEWMKVAIVSPGVPMEIALNKESKRKTPTFISFRDNERTFGEDAQNVAVRFPANGYGYLLDLLGKKIDNPVVQLFKKRFPHYKIVAHPERGTVVFQHDSETSFTVEELIAMMLNKGKEMAEESAGQAVNDAVLVVPGYFNQAERRAMLNAANLANIKVLQLMNDYTAVALNYGIFRRKDFNETAQYIMFYDMGASSTSATLVSYQVVKTKDRGVVETNPQLAVLGVGYDRTLGGLEVQLRLQKFLAEKFNLVKKTKKNVLENPRSMAKLFKEAARLKNVLSANADHYAQVEGVLDEEDFKVKVHRDDLEGLCGDLFDRVKGPVEQALKAAGLSMDVVNQVILVGAGTRMPKVQEKLGLVVNMELGKNINTDEAAVMGAVYKAADISTGFKVKKFITKDAVLLPIQVSFQRATDSDDVKHVKRTLFGAMNPFPQKKIITFNKHSKDFAFNVHYGDLEHLSENEIEAIGALNISMVSLSGVSDAIAKYQGAKYEAKGVKSHFQMDDSGLLTLLNVDYVVEKTVTEEDDDVQSTLQKLGSSFSKLFGGSDAEPVPVSDDKSDSGSQEEKEGGGEPHDTKTKEGAETNGTESKGSEDKKEEVPNAVPKNETEPVEKKPKVVVVKEELQVETQGLGVPAMTQDQYEALMKRIKDMDEYDEKKRRKEKARNGLESFVFDAGNKLQVAEYQKAATSEEIESIGKACSEISEWLDDEGFDAEAEVYEEKLVQMRSLTGPLYRRVKEHEERPEALAALKAMINGSLHFHQAIAKTHDEASAKGDETIFTQVEMDTLSKLIQDTQEWKTKTEEEQSKLPLSVNPKLTIKSVMEKMAALDREVKYLVNKAKIWKPKKEKPKTQNKTEEATTIEDEKKQEEPKTEEEGKKETEKEEEEDVKIEAEEPAPVKEEIVEDVEPKEDESTHEEL